MVEDILSDEASAIADSSWNAAELAVEIINRTGTFRRTLPARVMQVTAVLASGNPRWLVGCAWINPLGEDEVQALAHA